MIVNKDIFFCNSAADRGFHFLKTFYGAIPRTHRWNVLLGRRASYKSVRGKGQGELLCVISTAIRDMTGWDGVSVRGSFLHGGACCVELSASTDWSGSMFANIPKTVDNLNILAFEAFI